MSYDDVEKIADEMISDDVMLRDLKDGHIDPYDWSVLQTIVWIATRDEAAVRGAARYIEICRTKYGSASSKPRLQPERSNPAEHVLRCWLPIDVAGHHSDCGQFMFNSGPCSCDELGRPRYCRSSDRGASQSSTCRCSAAAERAFLEAFRNGLPASGRRNGEFGYDDIDERKRVGASIKGSFDDGLRLLPDYAEIKVPVKEILQRWPADFGEQPVLSGRARVESLQQAALNRLSKVNVVGRPADVIAGLKIFCDRLDDGVAASNRVAEGKAIRSQMPLNARGEVPREKTIRQWIGPHHKLIDLARDGTIDCRRAKASALSDLEARVNKKTDGRKH